MEKHGGKIKIPLQQDYVDPRFWRHGRSQRLEGKIEAEARQADKPTTLQIFSNALY